MARVFRLELELTDKEYQALARAAAGVQEGFARFGRVCNWSLELELEYLLRQALRREAMYQEDRDRLARELGTEQARIAIAVGLGDAAPAAPDWLVKLLEEVKGGDA